MEANIQKIAPGGPSGWLPIIAGLVLGLLGIGLPMIGVTINLWLGFSTLAVAFGLIAWGCWIWEGKLPRRKPLRILTICIIAGFYFTLVGIQIRAQYKKDHALSVPVSLPQTNPPPTTTIINQTATDSECSNLVAGSDAQIKCEATEKERHDLPDPVVSKGVGYGTADRRIPAECPSPHLEVSRATSLHLTPKNQRMFAINDSYSQLSMFTLTCCCLPSSIQKMCTA
jgi:hypothetical protein